MKSSHLISAVSFYTKQRDSATSKLLLATLLLPGRFVSYQRIEKMSPAVN